MNDESEFDFSVKETHRTGALHSDMKEARPFDYWFSLEAHRSSLMRPDHLILHGGT